MSCSFLMGIPLLRSSKGWYPINHFPAWTVKFSLPWIMTQFEIRKFWFGKNIPLLAEEGWLRGQSRSREATFFRADGREAVMSRPPLLCEEGNEYCTVNVYFSCRLLWQIRRLFCCSD